MRFTLIALLISACVWTSTADVTHIKVAKAKLLGRLTGKHHKRGILSPIPTYKLGHDIPHVTHSVVKPLVVTYPPTATVASVKIPVSHPLLPRYPIGHGHEHKAPFHPHFGIKYPHTKFVLPNPDQHFHHHHHHLAPRPIVPVVPAPPPVPIAPVVPFAQPTATVAHPIPAPSPPVIVPSFVPQPVAPPPLQILPPHLHFKQFPQLLPSATVPLPPPAVLSAPTVPLTQQYVIRPGNAVQTSVFATYPRFPLLNYQSPLIPFGATAPPVHQYTQLAAAQPLVPQVLLQRPQVQQYVFPHVAEGGVIEQPTPNVAIEQTPTLIHPTHAALPQPEVHVHAQALPQPAVHLQPTQPSVAIDHDGWAPVQPQQHDVAAHSDAHFHQAAHHFTQEQGTQVYEHHTGDEQYHDYQNQLQHHIQHQIEQAQYEQHLNNQHQLNQEYGTPQLAQPNEYQQDYAQHAHEHAQHALEYAQHAQEYAQNGQDYTHGHGQDYAHQGQDFSQHAQDFGQGDLGQPAQEYGVPQGAEGRSADDQGQQFQNHIPLALQPPIDRPLDHFR